MAGDPDDKSLSDPWGHLFLQNETGPTGGRPGGTWEAGGQGRATLGSKGALIIKVSGEEKGSLGENLEPGR